MENLLQIILLWYFIPLVISFSFSYVCIKYDLKTNENSELEVFLGLSFLPIVNILLTLIVLGTLIITLCQEFGKYLIKTTIKK